MNGQRHDSSSRHAAPLHNCKYRWLQAVATINSRSIACKVFMVSESLSTGDPGKHMSSPPDASPPYNSSNLALAPGFRLGPYEIVAAIGAGGMGEVYRARDTRLERTV